MWVTAGKTLLRFASDGPRRCCWIWTNAILGQGGAGTNRRRAGRRFPQLRARSSGQCRINASVDNARVMVEIELALTAAAEHFTQRQTVWRKSSPPGANRPACCRPPPMREGRAALLEDGRALGEDQHRRADCRPVASDGWPERRQQVIIAGAAAG